MAEPRDSDERKASKARSLQNRRTVGDNRRGRRPFFPETKPTTIAEAMAFLGKVKSGVILYRLSPRTVVRDITAINEDINRSREWRETYAVKPPRIKNIHRNEVTAVFDGELWRGRFRVTDLWTYADSMEALVWGLIEMYYKVYDSEHNATRWEQYVICSDVGFHELEKVDKERQRCILCATIVSNDGLEVNPPYDPSFDLPAKERVRRFVLTDKGKVKEEPHLVIWASWITSTNLVLAQTIVNETSKVLTYFRPYCDHDPPLLFENVIEVGKNVFTLGRHTTRIVAAIQHDRVAKELSNVSS